MRRLTGALLLALIFSAGIAAQEEHLVRIDSRVGFRGFFKPGHWTPVELTIQNLGRDIRGSLVVELDRRDRFGPDRHTNSFVRELDLAAGSVKSFSFILPVETAVYPLKVLIRQDNETIVEEQVKLAGRGVPSALVAVLSRTSSLDFLLPAFNSSESRSMDIVYPLVEYLPRSWHGYDGVDLLVAHDARLQGMEDAQVEAIRGWVAAGGRLVVSAGAHVGPADAEVLARLTGFVPTGVDVVPASSLGLAELGLSVVPDELDSPAVVSIFRHQDDSGDPAGKAAVLRIGRGHIVVLPFDYSQFVRVAPVTAFGMWISILPRSVVLREEPGGPTDPGIVPIAVSRRVFESDLIANQLDLPLYDFPSRLLVAGLALSFLIVTIVILLWASSHRAERRARIVRPALGAAAIIVVAALVSLVSQLTLNVGQQPAEALAFTLELAELGPDDGYAMITRDIALFSRKRADYEISFPQDPVIIPLDSADQVIRALPGSARLDLPVERWGYRNTVVMDIRKLDIRARLHRGIGYVNVEVSNESALPLGGTVVLAQGFPTKVADIDPGDVAEKVVMSSGLGKWEEIPWQEYVPQGVLSGHQAQLLRDLARRQRDRNERGEILIVGWTPTPLVEARILAGFNREIELTAVVIRASAPQHDGSASDAQNGGREQ